MTLSRSSNGSRSDGFTVIELLVAMSILLGVTGTIFTLVNPSQGNYRVQPEAADMQQRLRVAADRLHNHMLMAGAGMYSGSGGGTLTQFFAPVLPYRVGKTDADPAAGVFFRDDAISLVYVPNTPSQATLAQTLGAPVTQVTVTVQPGCPDQDPVCGFDMGQTVLVFDETGASDVFQVTGVNGVALALQAHSPTLSKTYEAGAYIARVERHTYHLDSTANQLMHYDGWEADIPLVDDVVGLGFRYFGDPDPPTSPRPALGSENCLFDDQGNSKLDSLTPTHGSLVELNDAHLDNGPWCGGDNQFDADLYRVRQIRVDLRLQVSAVDLRGTDPTLFRKPGLAVQGTRMVPDYEMSLDVSPRNMNASR